MQPLNLQHQDVINLRPRKYTPGTVGKRATTEDCFDLRLSFTISENLQAEMEQWRKAAEKEQ